MKLTMTIDDDLGVRVAGVPVMKLSPRTGLRLAEELARKSFRRVLDEEAQKYRSAAGGRHAEMVDD